MPRIIRKFVGGAWRVVRRGGRLARQGCISLCCGNTEPRYVKTVDCCFPTQNVAWVNITAACPDGRPVWTTGGPPRVFVGTAHRTDGSRICLTTVPSIVLGRAQVLAMDPNALLLDATPGTCTPDNSCSEAPCSCPSCCASGTINPCGPGGPGAGLCCECGDDFRLNFAVNFHVRETQQQQIGIVGAPPSLCPNGPCQNPLSGEILFVDKTVSFTMKMDYHCNASGGFDVTCVGYSLNSSEVRPTYKYPTWYNELLAGFFPSTCPPADGWLPSLLDNHALSCVVGDCNDNNPCQSQLRLIAQQACSLDQGSADAIASAVGAGLFYGVGIPGDDVGAWNQYRASHCSGHLAQSYTPYGSPCPGNNAAPAARFHEWSWNDQVQCLGGNIGETYRWTSENRVSPAGYYTGQLQRSIVWTITRNGRCTNDPCTQPQPIYTPNRIDIESTALGTRMMI